MAPSQNTSKGFIAMIKFSNKNIKFSLSVFRKLGLPKLLPRKCSTKLNQFSPLQNSSRAKMGFVTIFSDKFVLFARRRRSKEFQSCDNFEIEPRCVKGFTFGYGGWKQWFEIRSIGGRHLRARIYMAYFVFDIDSIVLSVTLDCLLHACTRSQDK